MPGFLRLNNFVMLVIFSQAIRHTYITNYFSNIIRALSHRLFYDVEFWMDLSVQIIIISDIGSLSRSRVFYKRSLHSNLALLTYENRYDTLSFFCAKRVIPSLC